VAYANNTETIHESVTDAAVVMPAASQAANVKKLMSVVSPPKKIYTIASLYLWNSILIRLTIPPPP
jgi:hypothetical protein